MKFLPLCLFVLLVTLSPLAHAASPAPGALAPDFTLQGLDGSSVTLSKLRGKVVFLNFWATWCPPCRAEMPSMGRLNEVFSSRDFVMLAVNVEEDGKQVLPGFLAENPHNFTVLIDSDAKVQGLYDVNQFPETFIIGRDGKIVSKVIGSRDWSDVATLKAVNGLLNEK